MTREEVEVWVNPSAWDDPDEAARVIEEILSSGSTDEAEWVRIAGGRDEDIAAADERAWGAVEELIHRELGAYREASLALDEARAELYEVLRRAMDGGVSAYRLAKITGLSQALIGRIRR